MTTEQQTAVTQACPFCGGEGDISFYARTSSPDPAGYFVECMSCAAAGPSFEIQGDAPDRVEYTKSKAITAWNTRLASPASGGDSARASGDAVAWMYEKNGKIFINQHNQPWKAKDGWEITPLGKIAHTAPAEPVQCAARKQGSAGGNDPADCDWPFCGCDPYADKVLEALEEGGRDAPAEPVGLREAVEGIADDYMTSETHHPGYVLIPTAKFDQIVAVIKEGERQ